MSSTDYEKCITSGSIEMENLETIPSSLSRLFAANKFVCAVLITVVTIVVVISSSHRCLNYSRSHSVPGCLQPSVVAVVLFDVMNYTHLNRLLLKSLPLARSNLV